MEFIGSGKDVVKKIQLLPSSSSSRGEGDALPALLVKAPSQTVAGFDCVGADDVAVSLHEMDDKVEELQGRPGSNKDTAIRAYDDAHVVPYSVSLSMPASPSGFHLSQFMPVAPTDHVHRPEPTARSPRLVKQTRFHSQPIVLNMNLHPSSSTNKNVDEARRWDSARDKRFDPFKTFSGRLERQLSNLRGRPQDPVDGVSSSPDSEEETDQVPAADRYFDALEGPELDTLRATEVPVLPKDEKWPFLLRFPISAFGMCLGVSSQAILWKTLASAPATAFLRVSPAVSHALWYVALALTALVSSTYLLKVVFYLEAVRREFYHPVRANFFFAPWIACLFLALGAPRLVVAEMHRGVWYALMAPILCLELKIYGQWMSGGQRRLSKVANPSNHLSVVGNFVGALLGARMGLREGPVFFFAVGLAHYLVLFVTLYQRLPTNVTLPKELHPVFFLFVAAPSVASMAWAKINGQFDNGARIAYFIALFLYMSLAVRINFFRGFRFSLAWWAYTFPMTGASVATITYATEVTNVLTRALSIGLSGISTVTAAGLLVTTVFHAFVLRDLFPNDVSIAITRKKPKFSKILAQVRSSSSDMKELVLSLSNKPAAQSDCGDTETDPSVTAKSRAEP
ncbi:S-type anion channel SLAH3 [Zea mays]|uniref:S-type anion channel SLAH3 n=1 Tax=Zea mays TaxID=4577 RepID=A0A1D6FZR3_MAIZE|nr:S-type anion channel SLAH3 [Zea mays]